MEKNKDIIKTFLFVPFKGNKVYCQCGKIMKINNCGSSYNHGTFGFKCSCGKKLIGVWEFSEIFIHPYDKAELIITKNNIKSKLKEVEQ
jgi:hypothetical protein